MFFTVIIASWVKFDIPVSAIITVGAIAGWVGHGVVVGNSFVSLDPISSQWLRLPGGKQRALDRVATMRQQHSFVMQSRPCASSSLGERELLAVMLCQALMPPGSPPSQQQESHIHDLVGHFISQDLSLDVLSRADSAQLFRVLESSALSLTLGEQLLIHRAVKEVSKAPL